MCPSHTAAFTPEPLGPGLIGLEATHGFLEIGPFTGNMDLQAGAPKVWGDCENWGSQM